MSSRPLQPHNEVNAFTLVELMVSMAVLIVIMGIVGSIILKASQTWSYTRGKIEEFRDARVAFETITRRLSQAELNTYEDYQDAFGSWLNPGNATTFVPARYARRSELRFLSGPIPEVWACLPNAPHAHSVFFQAPLGFVTDTSAFGGMINLLNTWGFYLDYNSDSNFIPPFLLGGKVQPRTRFRIMEMMLPSESLTNLFTNTANSNYTSRDWVTSSLNVTGITHPLADNIVALVLLPQLSPAVTNNPTALAPSYLYDSSTTNAQSVDPLLNPVNQLPPMIEVTMVAVDENSAIRKAAAYSGLTNMVNFPFTNSVNFSNDLAALQSYLTTNGINFRVFSTVVSLKAAKWSALQKN